MDNKRYPISMWAKLTRIVNNSKVISHTHKEQFIEIVGTKVATYRNQRFPRRYKPQKLPKALYNNHPELNCENYHSILYWDDERLSPILDEIYIVMAERWFGIKL